MRRAFTLIEVIVSIAIFVVASTLMFGALFGATEVFRRGEASRQAGDEATAVIAALQEDLSRAVPIRLRDGVPAGEWGRIKAEVLGAAGNCHLLLVIENPDRGQVRWVGSGATATVAGVRQQVDWFVDDQGTPDPSDDELVREVQDLDDGGHVIAATLRSETITRGCLHFGVWAEVAQAHRVIAPSSTGPDFRWESTDANEEVVPFRSNPFDTSVFEAQINAYPQPDAIRVSLVLTGGGRFATRGTLVQASGSDWRISGIKALPTISGSLLRVGDEWIRYGDFRGGQLRDVQPTQLRSQAGGRNRGDLVLAGQPFSLVVALPR